MRLFLIDNRSHDFNKEIMAEFQAVYHSESLSSSTAKYIRANLARFSSVEKSHSFGSISHSDAN